MTRYSEGLSARLQKIEDTHGINIIPPNLDIATISTPFFACSHYGVRSRIFELLLHNDRNSISADTRSIIEKRINGYNRMYTEVPQSPLVPRQEDTMDKIIGFMESPHTGGYIKLPPRSGKTVIYSELIRRLSVQGFRCVVASPKKHQVKNSAEELGCYGPRDATIGKVYSQHKDYSDDITVITDSTLKSGVEEGNIDPSNYDLLIVDEVHKSLGAKSVSAIQKFIDAGVKVIGFTATSEYHPSKTVSHLLTKEIDRMSILEGIDERLICDYVNIIVRTTADLSTVRTNSRGEYNQGELEEQVDIPSRNKAAVDVYKQAFDGKKVMGYCVGIQHAEHMAKLFIDNGISAGFVHGSMSDDEQERRIRRFKNGFYKVLFSADLLIDGYNDADLAAVFNLSPSRSRVVVEQRGARCLTLDKNNEGKVGAIVEFLDQSDGSTDPMLFEEVVEGPEVVPDHGKALERKAYKRKTPKRSAESVIPDIDTDALQITVNIDEITSILSEKKKKREQGIAPEGWLDIGVVVSDLKEIKRQWLTTNLSVISSRFVETDVDEDEVIQYYGIYRSRDNGKRVTHIHPDLVGYIKKLDIGEVFLYGDAPPTGWQIATEIGYYSPSLLGKLYTCVRNEGGMGDDAVLVAQYPVNARIKRLADYYHPKLIEKIRGIKSGSDSIWEKAPEGWLKIEEVVNTIHRIIGSRGYYDISGLSRVIDKGGFSGYGYYENPASPLYRTMYIDSSRLQELYALIDIYPSRESVIQAGYLPLDLFTVYANIAVSGIPFSEFKEVYRTSSTSLTSQGKLCIFINGDERQAFYPASYLSQIAEDLQKRKKWHTAESLSEELQVPIEKINEVIVYIFIKGWQAGYAIRFGFYDNAAFVFLNDAVVEEVKEMISRQYDFNDGPAYVSDRDKTNVMVESKEALESRGWERVNCVVKTKHAEERGKYPVSLIKRIVNASSSKKYQKTFCLPNGTFIGQYYPPEYREEFVQKLVEGGEWYTYADCTALLLCTLEDLEKRMIMFFINNPITDARVSFGYIDGKLEVMVNRAAISEMAGYTIPEL